MPRSQGTSRKGKPKKNDRISGMGKSLTKNKKKHNSNIHHSNHGDGGMALTNKNVESIGIAPEHPVNNMKSVLEINDLNDFRSQAEMSNKEFITEHERYVIVDNTGVEYNAAHDYNDDEYGNNHRNSTNSNNNFIFKELSVPRRPKWTKETTPDELNRLENESFINWRRSIALYEEQLHARQNAQSTTISSQKQINVTPFEKNLNVWKQLWRVCERCNIVIQIVDGRNPLFYLSDDLKSYVEDELDKPPMILIINKSDYLSTKQRKLWSNYLNNNGWYKQHVFFSAYKEQSILDNNNDIVTAEKQQYFINNDNNSSSSSSTDDNGVPAQKPNNDDAVDESNNENNSNTNISSNNIGIDQPLTRKELLNFMYEFALQHGCKPEDNIKYDNRIQYGMVGFPNVGKSSVINVLVGVSKHDHNSVRVGVAAQPGKTKHFQTILLKSTTSNTNVNSNTNTNVNSNNNNNNNIEDNMMLCDCPGLVFPSFVSNTADLIASGVYPISQISKDYLPTIELICQRIPLSIFNAYYGIKIKSKPTLNTTTTNNNNNNNEQQQQQQQHYNFTTPILLLDTYCIARSMYSSSSGVPDHQKASRIIINDYATGKLLYCHCPPPPSSSTTTNSSSNTNSNNIEEIFYKETLMTALNNTKKLRDKLLVSTTQPTSQQEQQHPQQQKLSSSDNINDDDDDEDNDDDDVQEEEEDDDDEEGGNDLIAEIENDFDILDIIGGNSNVSNNSNDGNDNGGKRGKKHKSIQKHGKKGRKGRNKDPYGCHTATADHDDDDNNHNMLLSSISSSTSSGVYVNTAGNKKKNHRKNKNKNNIILNNVGRSSNNEGNYSRPTHYQGGSRTTTTMT